MLKVKYLNVLLIDKGDSEIFLFLFSFDHLPIFTIFIEIVDILGVLND